MTGDYVVMREVPPVAAAHVIGSHTSGRPEYAMIRTALRTNETQVAVVNGVRVTVIPTDDQLMLEIHVDRRDAER